MNLKLHYRATFSILIGSMLLVSTETQRQRHIEPQRNRERDNVVSKLYFRETFSILRQYFNGE